VWSVEDDEFEDVPGPVRPEQEITEWVVADLLDGERAGHGMVDVVVGNAMATRRREDVHTLIS
jgi:hypothetical protein